MIERGTFISSADIQQIWQKLVADRLRTIRNLFALKNGHCLDAHSMISIDLFRWDMRLNVFEY